MSNKTIIDNFHGEYYFLSNFSDSPFWMDGHLWKTVEHAFQAAKCINKTEYVQVRDAKTPSEAKKLGRKVAITPYWEAIKDDVMKRCLEWKFLTNPELCEKLLATGDAELIEGTTWHDNYWGNCTCPKCVNKPGGNHLGQALMHIRQAIREDRYIWIMRDTKMNKAIIYCYKTRERALDELSSMPHIEDKNSKNPYVRDRFYLEPLCLK